MAGKTFRAAEKHVEKYPSIRERAARGAPGRGETLMRQTLRLRRAGYGERARGETCCGGCGRQDAPSFAKNADFAVRRFGRGV